MRVDRAKCRQSDDNSGWLSRFAAETDDLHLQFGESGCKFAFIKGFWHYPTVFLSLAKGLLVQQMDVWL